MEDDRSLRYPEDILGSYLRGREGRIWRSKDTAFVLRRADEIDDLLESLMVAAGVQVLKPWPAYDTDT